MFDTFKIQFHFLLSRCGCIDEIPISRCLSWLNVCLTAQPADSHQLTSLLPPNKSEICFTRLHCPPSISITAHTAWSFVQCNIIHTVDIHFPCAAILHLHLRQIDIGGDAPNPPHLNGCHPSDLPKPVGWALNPNAQDHNFKSMFISLLDCQIQIRKLKII